MIRNAIAIGMLAVSVGDATQGPPATHAPVTHGQYIVKPGDHLGDLSRQRYGNEHYSWVVSAYNRISDEDRIAVGDSIDFPAIAVIMERLGVDSVAAGAGALIASAADSFESCAPELWNNMGRAHPAVDQHGASFAQGLSGMTNLRFDCPEELQSRLRQAAAEIDSARKVLAASGGAAQGAPILAARSLDAASHGMRALADGFVDGNGYDIDLVSQALSKSIRNLILWARNGYH
jgi:hypothetical protein